MVEFVLLVTLTQQDANIENRIIQNWILDR
jgi:hypothetical protein